MAPIPQRQQRGPAAAGTTAGSEYMCPLSTQPKYFAAQQFPRSSRSVRHGDGIGPGGRQHRRGVVVRLAVVTVGLGQDSVELGVNTARSR